MNFEFFLDDLEVDGDEFAVGGFDEVAGVGVCYFHACDWVEPAVVAVRNITLVGEPFCDFFKGRLGAVDVGLGNDEGGALFGFEDAVEPDVVTEEAIAGVDVA